MAGIGAALNTGNAAAATRSRCSAAAGSATRRSSAPVLAGATTVIAVDVDVRKLAWAQEFGATHIVNSARPTRSRRSGR